MVYWCNCEMVKWILNGKIVISVYRDIVWQYIVRSNMWHYTIFPFSKHLENIRVYDLPDSHALKNQLESITEEVNGLRQFNTKQHNTLNRSQKTLNGVDNFLGQLCSGNRQKNLYTASTNAYKSKKNYLYLTSEDKNKDYVCVKPGISRSQKLEEQLNPKVVIIFLKSSTGQYQSGMFLNTSTGKWRVQIWSKLVLWRKVYIGSWTKWL